MSCYKKIIAIVFLVFVFVLNLLSEQITNGIISKTYYPYRGVVVVLDSGHGGKDDGARYGNVKEQDLNLSIVKKIKTQLEGLGMKVILTREDHHDLAGDMAKNRKKEDMKKRMAIINDKKVDFFISVHMNAYADKSVQGMQIFYPEGDHDSLQFASDIQTSLADVVDKQMEIKEGDYYLLNHADTIGILLECGFLSNENERMLLVQEKYQEEFAKGVKDGIVLFMQRLYD